MGLARWVGGFGQVGGGSGWVGGGRLHSKVWTDAYMNAKYWFLSRQRHLDGWLRDHQLENKMLQATQKAGNEPLQEHKC